MREEKGMESNDVELNKDLMRHCEAFLLERESRSIPTRFVVSVFDKQREDAVSGVQDDIITGLCSKIKVGTICNWDLRCQG